MNDTEKEILFQKAALHIKTLLKNVKCVVCEKITQNPQIGVCGHTACSSCWRPLKNCQLCGVTSFIKLVPDITLLSRTRAVLQLAQRFEKFTGINVVERLSADNWKGSSQHLFKDDRFSMKYERKRVISPPKKLHSVSRNSTLLIFPGEDVDSTIESDVKKDKPSSAEKVEGWLKAQQNKFNRSDSDLSVSRINPDTKFDNSTEDNVMNRKSFIEKTNRSSLSRKNSRIIQTNLSSIQLKSSPSPPKKTPGVKKISEIDFDEIKVVSSEYLDEIENNDSHLNEKDFGKPSKKSCCPFDKSVEDTQSLSGSNRHDVSDNSPLKMSTSAINDIIGIQLKPLNVSDEGKNKHPWESVQKMKRVLGNKHTVKKLDISIENHSTVTPKGIESREKIYSSTPFTIEDCVTPRHDTKECPVQVISSDTSDSLPETFLKDQLALRRVAELSKLMDGKTQPSDSSLQQSNSGSSRVVQNILSDFEIDNFTDQAECSRAGSLSLQKPSGKLKQGAFPSTGVSIHSKSLHTSKFNIECQDNAKKPLVNFFYGSKLKNNCFTSKIKKIPFYYKSNCISKDWYRAPQDGVNIEICRDNVVTSIVVRNQPLSEGVSNDNIKIVQTRDAQTSPVFKATLPASNRPDPIELRDYDDIFEPESQAIPLCEGTKGLQHNLGISQLNVDSGDKQIKSRDDLINSVRNSNMQAAVFPSLMHTIASPGKELSKKALGSDNEFFEDNPDNFSDPVMVVPPGKKVSEILTPRSGGSFRTTRADVSLLVIEDSGDHSQLSNSTLNANRMKRLRNITESDTSLAKKLKLGGNMSPSKENVHANDDVMIQFESQIRPTEGEEVEIVEIEGKTPDVANSEPMNYDEIIGTVFADIDRDDRQKKEINLKAESRAPISIPSTLESVPKISKNVVDRTNLKNISMEIDDSIVCSDVILDTEKYTQKNITNVIPKIVTGFDKAFTKRIEGKPILPADRSQLKTPNLDSDSSVVEDTPQKPRKATFVRKLSQRSNSASSDSISSAQKQDQDNMIDNDAFQKLFPPLENDSKIDDVSDLVKNVNEASGIDETVVEKTITNQKENSPEKVVKNEKNRTDTPLSITQFSKDVKYRSTPVHIQARRSLIYNALPNVTEEKSFDESSGPIISDKENFESCRSPVHTKSRIENDFLERAFDSSGNSKTPKTSIESPDGRKSSILFATHTYSNASNDRLARKVLKTGTPVRSTDDERKTLSNVCPRSVVLGCSCLNHQQVAAVKAFAMQRGWSFSEAYIKDLTHLIVKVDDSNKSQRSVKYIRALAAGNWILSFEWVLQCAKTDSHIPEGPYEVLDSAGFPGPYISRTERGKMFRGIKFFCFPPFAILDVDILTEILTNAGGMVMDKFDDIKIKDSNKICLLLGELNSTQEDRFINICVLHPVVAVNIEWALECLGKGSMVSINNWLLVPKTLLPPVNWPHELFPDDEDSIGSQ